MSEENIHNFEKFTNRDYERLKNQDFRSVRYKKTEIYEADKLSLQYSDLMEEIKKLSDKNSAEEIDRKKSSLNIKRSSYERKNSDGHSLDNSIQSVSI